MRNNNNKKYNIISKIISGVAISLGTQILKDMIHDMKNYGESVIDIGEFNDSYVNLNKLLYDLNPVAYTKRRSPVTMRLNSGRYDLSLNSSYIVAIDKMNYLKITAYSDNANANFQERRLRVQFYGRDRYKNREEVLKSLLRFTDKDHIQVRYLDQYEVKCDITPHSFDDIVLKETTKSNIINGLIGWKNSKDWYEDHQLVYKIGILLYGQPGTGKSTVAKAISNMFDNAPILTVNSNSIMQSVNSILQTRQRYDCPLIVLIEDFDMCFKTRENGLFDTKQQEKEDPNQNAIFQLLDGIYSTDNTIYIATTNHKDRIDPALIRHGRFDIQEELDYFDEERALKFVEFLGYDDKVLKSLSLTYPVQPAYLQSKIMEYRSNIIKEEK